MHGIIGLQETLENTRLHRSGDTDPGINHFKLNLLSMCLGMQPANPEPHLTLGGKFDGIPHEVDQHLPQTINIASHMLRQGSIDIRDTLDS